MSMLASPRVSIDMISTCFLLEKAVQKSFSERAMIKIRKLLERSVSFSVKVRISPPLAHESSLSFSASMAMTTKPIMLSALAGSMIKLSIGLVLRWCAARCRLSLQYYRALFPIGIQIGDVASHGAQKILAVRLSLISSNKNY